MDLHLGRHVGGASSTCRFVSGALSPRVCKAVDSSITSYGDYGFNEAFRLAISSRVNGLMRIWRNQKVL